ncbi:MAG: SdrD B-like domain-containing protein, partial [Gammaproteobacteria bacterium]
MTNTTDIDHRPAGGSFVLRLFACLVLMLSAQTALAEDCSDYPGGIIDGAEGTPAPSQLQIDRNCTIRNFPASNPLNTNFSFLTQPGQTDQRWIVIFDNVVHTGEMACNDVAGHKIWFTNGSSTSIKEGCQNYLIPVEKIDKQNPAGQSTAFIGVPFTYTLTMPVLFDPATDTVINTEGSLNDLHGVTLWDDLNATGVDLTYLSHTAYWLNSGDPVSHTFSNVGSNLTFDNFPIIPAGQQIVIELTVVLEDTARNAPGTRFINTAKWDFGRLIDGEFFEPLPGEWGISDPLTIAGPELAVAKTGPATLNLGESADFTIDVQNTGNRDAWEATILDRLPDGITGGMCDAEPEILGARVFAGDGVTPVPGKGPLAAGTDFSLSYSGAPVCELSLSFLTPAATIAPGERLIITYRTQLDADTQNGVSLTNVAGATQWFDVDDSNSDRRTYNRTLTDGTVGVVDHEDAHTVSVALSGYFFEKTVANLATGQNPAATAAPGDRLRYTVRLRAVDIPFNNVRFYDDLGAMNAGPVFDPGTLTIVPGTIPPGADVSNTIPDGGTNGAGILDVRNLNVAAGSEVAIQFDVTLASALLDGTVVTNQAELIEGGVKIADSDDPTVNGLADPDVPGDEDPTRVVIEAEPPPPLLKATTQDTATIGESFSYRLTVPSSPHTAPLYDVRILDDLVASAADLSFVQVTKISGSGSWTPVNTGTDTNLVIEDPVNGIDIPAGEQITVEITVALEDSVTNLAGLVFDNTAAFTYNQLDNNDATQLAGEAGTSEPMTIIEPDLTLEKSGPVQVVPALPTTFSLNIHNIGESPAYRVTLTDILPDTATGSMCTSAPTQVTAQLFAADGTTPAGAPLTEGTDFSVAFEGQPNCTLTLNVLTPAAAIGPDQRLIVTYDAVLDTDAEQDTVLTNVAGATEWTSADPATSEGRERTYSRQLTDGTVGVLDHEDAHTVFANLPVVRFEKTVANVTTGVSPAAEATPGDRLRYALRVENLGDTDFSGFILRDELDRLNDSPAFQAGTLVIVDAPPGADTSGTSATGGANGTGLLQVAGLTVPANGGSITVEFEVTLAPIMANGTVVLNQSFLNINDATLALSDDPNVNGQADPIIADDEDPTRIAIVSAPEFLVQKTSADLTDDPDVLLAGETLRYTIAVENIGTDNAVDAVLSDQIPANTTYVAASTTLNGTTLDDVDGLSPLVNGMPVSSPADPTPGAMPAAPVDGRSNVATITFDVVVNSDVLDGTVISNQGFVSAVSGGVTDQPSDDPDTPTADDPTRDVVGNLPLLYAEKSVELSDDQGSPGIVDPGDVLRYTITVQNSAAIPATGVVLNDDVPANTTYVADSTLLNGLPAARPDGGVFPLASGLDIASGDLTPPLPANGSGTISAGETAVVQFDLRVNDGVPGGTIISNQAVVGSEELSDLLTDGDGNAATGPEPTVVVVGDAQQLSIAKQVSVVGGGPAVAGAELEYVVRVTNVAAVPAFSVVVTDDLDAVTPGTLAYVDQSARLNGSAAAVTVAGSTLVADYAAAFGPLQPGEEALLRFRAVLDSGLAEGATVTNTGIVTWNTPVQTASASVSIDIGGIPGVAAIGGAVWHDANFDNAQDSAERSLEGWAVELTRNGEPLATTSTDATGGWQLTGLAPNDSNGDVYQIRFTAPGAGPRTALLGTADSPFTDGLQEITDLVVTSGANLVVLNLPIDPNGVIYDSVLRTPISGATVSLLGAGGGAALPPACFDDAAQQGQITGPDGYYKFDLNFADPACPAGGNYVISVESPGGNYLA